MMFHFDQKTVAVFSHPNHEIAIFALLQKVKPYIIFLTDGGGEHRIRETKKGLASIGLEGQAVFLMHKEQSFYDALLHLDTDFFNRVVLELRLLLKGAKPEQILCDAVEFYNPVHDLTLALVGAADDAPWQGTFEVPLVYQRPGEKESYAVQCVPDGVLGCNQFRLTEEESAMKRSALENIYTILRDTLGQVILSSPTALQIETIFAASSPLKNADPGRVLRYEHRAASLKAEGKVKSEITHAFHFLPVVSELLGHSRT